MIYDENEITLLILIKTPDMPVIMNKLFYQSRWLFFYFVLWERYDFIIKFV